MRAAMLALMLAGVAQSGWAEQPSPPADAAKTMPEAEFRKGMMLDDVKQVIYLDVDGSKLDYAAFMSKVDAGASFNKGVNGDKSVATLKINEEKAPTVSLESLIHPALAIPVAGMMPALKHADLSGKKFDLGDGKHYSLLSFYFSECVPCIQEIPELNELKAQAPNLQVISVTFDDKATAQQFVKRRGLQWPVASGAKDFIDALGIKSYPTLVVVSPDGRLVGSRSAYVVSDDKDKQPTALKDWLASLSVKL